MSKLPSDALKGRSRMVPLILAGVGALTVAASAVLFGPAVATQLNPAPTPTPTAISVGDDSYAAPISVSPNSVEGTQEVAAAQAAAAQQAAAAAAAQAAADAAAKAAAGAKRATSPTGPVKCPAGSQANSGDGGNDTSCFPEICFHITLPDPAHPECVTAFKP